MKKMILMLVVGLFFTAAFSQEVKKNEYVLNGDLIEATLYHENGVIAQKGFYTLKNKLEGTWTSYDSQGNRTAVAQYDNGAKTGTWIFYNVDELNEVSYENNKIADVVTWTSKQSQVVTSNK